MSGKHQFDVLTSAYGKEHLMERGKSSGVSWDEHSDEGVNWFRFSNALIRHLENGGQISLEDTDHETLTSMLHHYTQLRELHKQTMIPHVRAAMAKLKSDDISTGKGHMEYLEHAYAHLDANGGPQWAEKVSTLRHLNHQIGTIATKLDSEV